MEMQNGCFKKKRKKSKNISQKRKRLRKNLEQNQNNMEPASIYQPYSLNFKTLMADNHFIKNKLMST